MTILPNTLIDFVGRARRRYGDDRVDANEDGAFVTLDDAIVHVRLDSADRRVALWTDLETPDDANFAAIEKAVMDYTSEVYLKTGFVAGVDRGAALSVLGRSVDESMLMTDSIFATVDALARASSDLGDWLRAASRKDVHDVSARLNQPGMTFQA